MLNCGQGLFPGSPALRRLRKVKNALAILARAFLSACGYVVSASSSFGAAGFLVLGRWGAFGGKDACNSSAWRCCSFLRRFSSRNTLHDAALSWRLR